MKTDLSIRAAIYLRAAELVEQGFSKGFLFRDADGLPVFGRSLQEPAVESDRCVSFCYRGAIMRARWEITGQKPMPADNGFNWADVGPHSMVSWNNAPERTAAEVAAKLREQAFEEEA